MAAVQPPATTTSDSKLSRMSRLSSMEVGSQENEPSKTGQVQDSANGHDLNVGNVSGFADAAMVDEMHCQTPSSSYITGSQAIISNETGTNDSCSNSIASEKIIKDRQKALNSVHKCIENSLSHESLQMISSLLEEIAKLSDIEKLFLYLKLPTGVPEVPDPLKINHNYPLGNRPHVTEAFTWIRTHLDEDLEVSLPKHEVYDSYRAYCQLHNLRSLSTADFGKAIKQVFPNVKPRRLGTRGNSRYCYSGLMKKQNIATPLLPNLEEIRDPNFRHEANSRVRHPSVDEDLISASSHLVCEWAEKLLSQRFDSIHNLAYHLVSNQYVDKRSVAAFTLLSVFATEDSEKCQQASSLLTEGGVSRHRDTQLQLQRKIQEKERIREQKRKVNDHQTLVRKGSAEKSSRQKRSSHPKCKDAETPTKKIGENVDDKKVGRVARKVNSRAKSFDDEVFERFDSDSKVGGKSKIRDGDKSEDDKDDVSRSDDRKREERVANIIFVPSMPTLKLSAKSTKPKYKPIQPKPQNECPVSVDKTVVDYGQSIPSNVAPSSTKGGNAGASSFEVMNRLKRSVGSERAFDDQSKKMFMDHDDVFDIGSVDQDSLDLLSDQLSSVADNYARSAYDSFNDSDDCSPPKMKLNSNESANVPCNQKEQLSQLRLLLQQNLNKDGSNSRAANDHSHHYASVEGATRYDDSQQRNANDYSALQTLLTKPNNELNIHPFPSNQLASSSSSQVCENRTGPFEFSPISQRQASQAESINSTRQSSLCSSPVPTSYPNQQALSVAACQSIESSPFVSPRNTPLSRSRHNSGQTSALRAIPFSMASESSIGSPFLSPHGTPVHLRSRHGSGIQLPQRFVTSRSVLPSVKEMFGPAENAGNRSRHISGSSIMSLPSLSPLSKSAPMSPMYSRFSGSHPDLTQHHRLLAKVQSQSVNRHSSAIGARQAPHDPSQEIRMLLQKIPSSSEISESSRCQSVPLYQMLHNINCNANYNQPEVGHDPTSVSKSYPATPCEHQTFNFPVECVYSDNSEVSYPGTPAADISQLPSYSGTPVMPMSAATSYPGTPVDPANDPYGQNEQLIMFNSFESAIANEFSEQQQQQQQSSDLPLNEEIQAALEDLKNCTDLSRLTSELEGTM